MSEREHDASGLALFAAELAAVRAAAGLSQEALAERIHYSASTIAMVESRRRSPRLELAERLDEALSTPGTFARLQAHARTLPLPSWFKPWADVEATARQLRLFEHSLVPGLLQTPDYARAILAVQPGVTADELDEMVAARLDRQAILAAKNPPVVWVVLDEAVLHRPIGGPKVMADQLGNLVDMEARPNVTIGIIPATTGAHTGLLGAFAVAESDDVGRAAYLESATQGLLIEDAAGIADLALTWDHLRAEALPRGASLDLIRREAESWT